MQRSSSTVIKGIACLVLCAIGTVIFVVLSYYSFFYTQYMKIRWAEVALDRKDQPIWNLAALAAIGLLTCCLAQWGKGGWTDGKKRAERVLLVLSALWILLLGFWWITALDRPPEGDQAFIYGSASYFLEGGYYFLKHGTYCQLYPQQLGQIFVVELLFRLVGTYNYFAIEVICVLMAAGIHLLGYGILKKMQAGPVARILYLLLMMGCIPLVCYTSWVYGDIPSTFFLFLMTYLTMRMQERFTWYDAAGAVLCFVMASLVRQNSMIYLVAFGILAFLDLLTKKRARMLAVAALALLCSVLSLRLIYKSYELRSGYPIEAGLPVNSWIGMGMMENWNGNGWYDDYPREVGAEYDWDFPAIERFFDGLIRGRLEEFRENPRLAFDFYKKKVLSQWNEPLYQSIFFSKNYAQDRGPEPGSFLDRLYQTGDAFEKALFLADRWQILIFVGMILYFAFGVRKEADPAWLLFAVTIVGGFFFSILWEAKSRYCLPYYLMAFALATLGYERFYDFVKRGVKHEFTFRRKTKPDGCEKG